jgi:hypothetical protein
MTKARIAEAIAKPEAARPEHTTAVSTIADIHNQFFKTTKNVV